MCAVVGHQASKKASAEPLTYEGLRDSVRGDIAAIRSIVTLTPAGGPGTKVFPPTYEGRRYATERRRLGDGEVQTVLLDSVQSQANRMELALLAAYRRGEIELPLLAVDFSNHFADLGEITALEAPHRIADAIFRDSILEGKPFRESGPGQRFAQARIDRATALLELCPTALIFGVWDSTGELGGLGAKFERALVSEIVGYQAVSGRKTVSRIDPLGIISTVAIHEAAKGGWTTEESEAKKDAKGAPVPYGRNARTRGKPSAINHGNVSPTADLTNDTGEIIPGGVTIAYAEQSTVLSLVALRRLRFPLKNHFSSEANAAGHTVLAALALAAIVYQRSEGYDLRSRCLLIPSRPPVFEVLPCDGSVPAALSFTAAQARQVFAAASEDARRCGLPWSNEKITLQPSRQLIQLLTRSRKLSTVDTGN